MSTERPSASTAAASPPAFRRILGIPFYTGDLAGLLALTQRGGLIVVPSAPVLVELPANAAHRAALEGADFAVTDSGLMVWLWFFRTGERLHRISGLKYLRALLEDPDFRGTSAPPPAPTAPPSSFDSRPSTSSPLSAVSSPAIPTRSSLLATRSCPSPTFWVMPSARDAEANLAWLQSKGVAVGADDCYLAPQYPAGPLRDPVLLDAIKRRRPRYIVLCVGGGVQERLGWYLKQALSEAPASSSPPCDPPGLLAPHYPLLAPSIPPSSLAPRPSASALPPALPAIICTGAAIAFLSGRQVNIPPWADRYVLGWLFRCLKEPGKFLPRYWKALRLVPLLLRHRDRGVMDGA